MKRILAALAVLLLLPVFASGETGYDPEVLIGEILREQTARSGQESLQGWIDTGIAEIVDGLGGWYLISLRRLEALGVPEETAGLSWRAARAALEEKAAQGGGITKRERMALTMQALGCGEDFVRNTLRDAAAEETLMPLVFALHLMNNGAEAEGVTREELAVRVAALQLADGGWAVIGNACDADCTAMTLQALAPMRENPQAAEAIERGLAALSAVQTETGGFITMGGESAESCAQAVIALTSLGIDPETDARFFKNGYSVLDEMMRFRVPGEGFAHDPDSGRMNETATEQCLRALCALENQRKGGGAFFVFDFPAAEETKAAPAGRGMTAREWILTAVGIGTAAALILALIRKKNNWRSYVFPLVVGAALAAVALNVEIQSTEEYYGRSTVRTDGPTIGTTISIRCDVIAGRTEYAPADGTLLAEETVRIPEGGTAFDQLMEAARAHRIQTEYDGTVSGAYVRSIGNIYEYAFGNLSGWMYRVNGTYADVGCSQYQLQDGDRVEWVYTMDIGRDVP